MLLYRILSIIISADLIDNTKNYDDYSQFYNHKYVYNCGVLYTPSSNHFFYDYIILTVSNPCNAKYRNIQRRYKNYYSNNMLFVYVLGYSNCDNILYYENKLYRDILLLKIKNHYFNITNLFLEAISFINMRYNYNYLIKWDDDIIVNIPLLKLFANLQKKLIHYCGYLYIKPNVCRDKKRICYIPSNIYNYSHLPSFVASGFLILSKYTSNRIDYYHRIYRSYLIRDDQYIGILCKKLFIKPLPLNRYYPRIQKKKQICKIKTIVAYHSDNYVQLLLHYIKLIYN